MGGGGEVRPCLYYNMFLPSNTFSSKSRKFQVVQTFFIYLVRPCNLFFCLKFLPPSKRRIHTVHLNSLLIEQSVMDIHGVFFFEQVPLKVALSVGKTWGQLKTCDE